MSATLGTIAVPASLLERSIDAFFVVDRELRVTPLNESAEQLFPDRESLAWKRLVQQFARAIRDGVEFHGTFTSDSGCNYSVDGCPAADRFVARLVAPRPFAKSASALKVSERDIERVLQRSDVAMLVVDAATSKISAVDDAFSALLGYSADELIGRDLRSITHPEDAVVSLQLVAAAEHGGKPFVLEKRYVHSSGEVVWVDLTVCSVSDRRSGRTRLLGFCRNITERKNAEQESRKSEWRFRSLIENLESVVTILDHEGTIIYHTPAVERSLGYDRGFCIGRNGFELIHPDDVAAVRGHWSSLLSLYGSVSRFEARFRHKDGSWKWFDTIAKNMLHNPAVRGIVFVSRDASDRVEAGRRLKEYATELEQQKLEAVSRSTPELSAIADEIRTPVTGMIGFAELLLDTKLSAPQRECAERIRDSGAQLLKLLDHAAER